MRRTGLFVLLLGLFVLWTFPHRRVVESMLARRLAGVDVAVSMRDVAPSFWPLGYRLDDVLVRGRGYSFGVQAVRLGFGRSSPFHADVCGGSLDGRVAQGNAGARTQRLTLTFEEIEPASCVNLSPLELSGSFHGSAALEGLGAGPPAAVLGRTARAGNVEIEGIKGVLAGALPQAPSADAQPDAAAKPIGSWEFARAAFRAHIEGPEVVIDDASAEAEGLHWEVSGGRLTPGVGSRTRINLDLRARKLDDSARAKAVLGLLPRAGEDTNGWRRYRISGTVDAPKIVGLK